MTIGSLIRVSAVGVLFSLWVSAAQGAEKIDSKPAKPKLAIHVGRIITCAGKPIDNGTILVSNGKIEALGGIGREQQNMFGVAMRGVSALEQVGLLRARGHAGGWTDSLNVDYDRR